MPAFLDFIFDNAYQVDAQAAESSVREKYPLLLHPLEKIELAFRDRGGKGRDKEYFTSHRILIKDGKGIGNKRKNYYSVPYSSISAFSVESAGSLDGDCELKVWAKSAVIKMDFARANVDVFQIYQLLNMKVKWGNALGTVDEIDPIPPKMDKKQTAIENMMDFLGDNAMQIDVAEVDRKFKTEFPILLANEKVQIAFKSGRDTTFFTDKRVMIVDVQGIQGKKLEFISVLYSCIHGYSIQTPGAFLDRDSEMTLFTSMDGFDHITQDFRHGKSNLFAIQKVLCNYLLGEDTNPLPEVDKRQGEVDVKGNWFFRDNQRPLDAGEMDQIYHTEFPILQGSEKVEMAFKGRRDITMFTTKRLLIINPKGLSGKKTEFLSIPWGKIVAYAIRTAGAILDFDSEVCFYTEMPFYPGQAASDDSPAIPPAPYMSYFELDFNKNRVDLYKLKYYLSKRLLGIKRLEGGAPIDLSALTSYSYDPSGFERLFQWLGEDQRELDANELDGQLHATVKVLLDDEKCLMAFKGGRDISVFTNLRVIKIDVQGMSGKKIEYTSLPYRNIRAYSVETAGVWDRDSELNLFTRNRWNLAKMDMDFRSGKTDILMIQKFLSGFVIGSPTDPKITFGPKNYEQLEGKSVGWSSFTAAFFDHSKEINAAEIDTKYRVDIPLLLEKEKVLRAFKDARDMCVFTNRRIIRVDTQGRTGERVKFKSIPYKFINSFEFETAGHLDRDAEVYAYTSISNVISEAYPRVVGSYRVKESLLVKHTDIYEMGKLFVDQLLFMEKVEGEVEPEIEIKF